MKLATRIVCFLVSALIMQAFLISGCDDSNSGGDNPSPPPNSHTISLAQRGETTPDGSKICRTIDDMFRGPNNSGLAFFRATLMNPDRTITPNNIGVFLAQ